MKAGKLLLLIAILVLGGSLQLAWSVREHIDIGPAGCRVLGGKFYGPSYSFESDARKELAAHARVEVDNLFGSVRVRPGAPGEVHVRLRTVVYLPTESAAREFASQVRLETTLDGSALKVSTNRRSLETRDVGFETNLEVEVPADTPVRVANEHGQVDVAGTAEAAVESSYDSVRVERIAGNADLNSRHGDVAAADIHGALALASRYGDVEAKDVAGRVTIESEHGDVTVSGAGGLRAETHYGDVTIAKVQGDLDVKGEHGGVRADDVTGAATIETSYQSIQVSKVGGDARLKTEHGEIEAKDVKGALSAEATYESVTLEKIGGPAQVKVEHGGLHAHDLAKGARIEALGDDVTIEGFRGPLEIDARRSNVTLTPQGPLTDAVTVTAVNGGITLGVPSGSRFDLWATVQSGEVAVDVPGIVVSETSPSKVVGKMGGGGSAVKLSTDHGDVSVSAHPAVATGDSKDKEDE